MPYEVFSSTATKKVTFEKFEKKVQPIVAYDMEVSLPCPVAMSSVLNKWGL